VLRYGSVNVPITSAAAVVYGSILLAADPLSFTAPAFQQGPFLLAERPWWGVAFIASGLLALAMRHVLALLPLLLVVCGWAISLLLASMTVKGVPPTASVWPMALAVQLLWSVSIRGTHPRATP
jgi:hypothetical protein